MSFITGGFRLWFQKRFDCVVREMTFSSADMHWMLAINSAFVPGEPSLGLVNGFVVHIVRVGKFGESGAELTIG